MSPPLWWLLLDAILLVWVVWLLWRFGSRRRAGNPRTRTGAEAEIRGRFLVGIAFAACAAATMLAVLLWQHPGNTPVEPARTPVTMIPRAEAVFPELLLQPAQCHEL